MSEIDLTNSQQLIAVLQKHQLYTQKKFGQNFLINRTVVNDSLKAANIQPTDIVVEIGAGTGVLTQLLAAQAKHVQVFEIDTSLEPLLSDTLADYSNITLHWMDFKLANLDNLLNNQPYKVVANLPYNAGTHILGQLVQLQNPPQSITVLLQKEVAEKITATTPHATYLSNFLAVYGTARIVRTVSSGSFFPAPKVESAILHLTRHQSPVTRHLAAFSRFLHRGFANPRKKINKAFTITDLEQAKINPNLRPENLSLEEWLRLFKLIAQNNQSEK